jgi:EAL domain-containing protein (putative c-di-GMP-specific phosphodiesterase class I)
LALLHDSAEPDVIVCDIDMPGMDGVEFIRNVAERELAGAVVIASALDSKVVQAVRAVSEGYGLQVLGAVAKPLTGRGLTDLLGTYRRTPRTRSASPASSHESITAADVRTALADGSICVDVQPGVEVATGLVTFADAVPRWRRPGAADLPYETFHPVVERVGLLAELFDAVLRQAARSVVDSAAEGRVELTVQLTPGLLEDASLADNAARTVREVGADPALITFALDERALRNAPGPALNLCTRLRVKGFNVAIDNFGSGNTPADQLRRFPCTQARIAPQLVAGAGRDRQRADALEAIAEVARTLDLLLVGGGCDSEDDLRLLLELGCGRVVGPLIAAPLPAGELARWLAGWDPTSLGVGERE